MAGRAAARLATATGAAVGATPEEVAAEGEAGRMAQSLFSKLSRGNPHGPGRSVFARYVRGGELFSLEGERPAEICFVLSGLFRLFKVSSEGKEQTLEFVHPGQFFNESAVVGHTPNQASSQAVEDSVVYCLNRDHYEAQLRSHPEIAGHMTRELCARAMRYVSLVEDLSLRTALGRVAKLLLDQDQASIQEQPHRRTHRQIAALAGVARESVARALKALEAEGLISARRRQIAVLDTEGLARVAITGHLRSTAPEPGPHVIRGRYSRLQG